MNSELINQVSAQMGANGLPYTIPIHPNLVHLTLGLFIVGVIFDLVAVLFPINHFLFKSLGLTVNRAQLFEVGWYNMVASSVITFFTVAAGFYEMLLASSPVNLKSSWGMQPMETMMWHGVGGVFLLALMVGMTFWRGWQRYITYKDVDMQVGWSYIFAGVLIMVIMYAHGTLGAQLAAEFGVHNTADNLLRMGEDINSVLGK